MPKISDDFKTLSLKDFIAYLTAILAFLIGWGVTIAGFIIPPVGDITDSVLWVLGQSLIYTSSILGVSMYVNYNIKRMERKLGIHDDKEKEEE